MFGRLVGYEDVNDDERLSCDLSMQTIVVHKGLECLAASSNQMGRFDMEWLATNENVVLLTNLYGV